MCCPLGKNPSSLHVYVYGPRHCDSGVLLIHRNHNAEFLLVCMGGDLLGRQLCHGPSSLHTFADRRWQASQAQGQGGAEGWRGEGRIRWERLWFGDDAFLHWLCALHGSRGCSVLLEGPPNSAATKFRAEQLRRRGLERLDLQGCHSQLVTLAAFSPLEESILHPGAMAEHGHDDGASGWGGWGGWGRQTFWVYQLCGRGRLVQEGKF